MNIEDHLPLVEFVAANFYRHGLPAFVDGDDLRSVGKLGLIDAASRFDPSRGVPFQAYARLCIHRAIVDELRRMDWMPRRERERLGACALPFVPIDFCPIEGGETIGEQLVDEGACAPREGIENRESIAAVRGCVEKLPMRERDVLTRHYFDGVSGADIARQLGISRQRISFLLRAAHERLRQWLSDGPDALAA